MRSMHLLLPLAASLLVLSCFNRTVQNTAVSPDDDVSSADSNHLDDTAVTPAPPAPLPPVHNLSVTQWTGHRFMLLDMLPVYRNFGYELYLTRELARSKTKPDTSLELPNRRVKYGPFHGTVASVTSVEPVDSEFLVTFASGSNGRALFGRTHKQAIKGLALTADRDTAEKRWKGRTIYSRRGFINTYSANNGVIATVRVAIETPLVVTGVEFGMPPMPPSPLWVMVRTPSDEHGFIPAAISWTNVMTDQTGTYAAWANDILETDPRVTWSWPEETWKTINRHEIVNEMDTAQVLLSWGHPAGRETVSREGTTCDRWRYKAQNLYFIKGILTVIENR